ncbi:hypothetical protein KSF73_11850 [Burkholderiaceae bacterium DAT-1]|nr:hypothetical protein [Burkholderiaceae bacterium DAT-1]
MASPGKKAYPLRIDPALWDTLERLAAAEFRSVNAQIECLLREALTARGIRPAEKKRPVDGVASDPLPDNGHQDGE